MDESNILHDDLFLVHHENAYGNGSNLICDDNGSDYVLEHYVYGDGGDDDALVYYVLLQALPYHVLLQGKDQQELCFS